MENTQPSLKLDSLNFNYDIMMYKKTPSLPSSLQPMITSRNDAKEYNIIILINNNKNLIIYKYFY